MLVGLINNIALLVALSSLYSLISRLSPKPGTRRQLLLGLLFGLVTVVGMAMPAEYAPGVIYDGRSIILSLAGLFGGALTAGVAALIAGIYRISLGGPGMWAGLATIVGCALVGLAFRRLLSHHLMGSAPGLPSPAVLYALGLAVHLEMLASQLLVLPWPSGLAIIRQIWLPVMLIFPLATLLIGLLIANEEERSHAERALRSSEARWTAVAETALDAIVITDDRGTITYWNPAAGRLFGYTSQEALGQNVHALLASGQKRQTAAAAHQAFARGGQGALIGRTTEMVARSKAGEEIPVELSLSAFQIEGRRHAAAIIRDIRVRKRDERKRERLLTQIRQQAQLLEEIGESIPVGLLVLNAEGRVLQANAVARRDLPTLSGAQPGDTLSHLGDHSLAEILTSPPTRGLWHEVHAGDRTFEVIARPIEATEEADRWVVVMNDVTRERQVRAQLQRQERLALVGQLAAGTAHDFNNALSVISLYADLAHRQPDTPPAVREPLQIIMREARLAADLTRKLLDFSGQSLLNRRTVDVVAVTQELVEVLQRTLPENIQVELTCDGEGDHVVDADPGSLHQALLNLAINARDAMPDGGTLRIDVSHIPATQEIRCATCGTISGSEWLSIAVSDTGTGIAPDVLSHIFEPFFTTKEAGLGSGLGLAQVAGIVHQHDGHVSVSSQLGEGTTVTLYLPLLAAANLVPVVEEPVPDLMGQGGTILLVEDNASLRAGMAEILRSYNYHVVEAANGLQALEMLEELRGIALVLSDVIMPQMGGEALLRAMRKRGLDIPVVLLTGYAPREHWQHLTEQGLVGWLLKPPAPEKLAAMVAQAIGRA